MQELRVGSGFDVHPFAAGRPLFLGGVQIPAEAGLAGHSDADVLLHAVIDALLGASGKDDIGARFPDTDPRWRNADSKLLLQQVWQELAGEGWRVVNMDCTVVAETPRIAPFRQAMRAAMSELLAAPVECCSVKATTCEKLGFVGRREGIAAMAVVLLQRRAG